MACIGRFPKHMKRIGRQSPLPPHGKGADQRVREGGGRHVANPFHIALTGQQPDIADEEGVDDRSFISHRKGKAIGPSGRNPREPGGELSPPSLSARLPLPTRQRTFSNEEGGEDGTFGLADASEIASAPREPSRCRTCPSLKRRELSRARFFN